MFKSKKVLAFIPARAGSKRIIGKNKKIINGKPLFEYSVDVAKESKYIDDVIVSSDSEEILKISHKRGCIQNKLRPAHLSDDHSRIIDSIIYEINENNLKDYDAVVLLQPTFPVRNVKIIDEAIEKYFEVETSLVTVIKIKEQPLMMRTIKNGKLIKILPTSSDIRSQDFPEIYKVIGCIYINNLHTLKSSDVLNENQVPFIIDNKYDIDIDTMDDFIKAELELKK